jgi:hypothetical protein
MSKGKSIKVALASRLIQKDNAEELNRASQFSEVVP